jgi:hypothetical protein
MVRISRAMAQCRNFETSPYRSDELPSMVVYL